MNRKNIRKRAILGLALLALCTLLSRPVRNMLEPRVAFGVAKRGTLSISRQYARGHWETERLEEVSIPFSLPAGLSIKEAYAERGDIVSKEQPLLRFEPISSEQALYAAEKERFARRTALDERRSALEDEIAAGEQEISDIAAEIAQYPEKQTALAKRLARAEKKLQGRIENAPEELRYLREDLRKSEEALEALQALAQSGWILVSPCDGILADIASAGIPYGGIDLLASIWAKAETANYIAEASDAPDLSAYTLSAKLQNAETSIENLPVSAERKENGTRFAVSAAWEQMAAMKSEAGLEITFVSKETHVLVPNTALYGSTVYVIQETAGTWRTEYVLEERLVNTGDGDLKSTAVLSGLQLGDRIVTASDRPIRGGVRVRLSY